MPDSRESYKHFQQITTRWNDNDVYGHVNNIEYYGYFYTVINTYLIQEGGLDVFAGPVIGVCAESHCRFLRELTFPEIVEAGLRVEHIGRSSVRYGIGLFGGGNLPVAEGWFVHVFVDSVTRRPGTLPAPLRAALELLLTEVKP
jgi:acyl-CoA thioester hydrolase